MELATHQEALAAQGLGVCSITYDTREVLADFAARRGITFPMLSDPDLHIIRRFGVFNETVAPETYQYGVPHPGIFFVDAGGVVREKYFEEQYYHRMALPTILNGRSPEVPPDARLAWEGENVRIWTWALPSQARPGLRLGLFIHVAPASGVHVYAPGGPDYLRAVTPEVAPSPYYIVHAPPYPDPEAMAEEILGETLRVYRKPFTIRVDIALAPRKDLEPIYGAGSRFTVAGVLRWQACTDVLCWPPAETPVAWDLGLDPPDLERVPEHLRRQPKVHHSPLTQPGTCRVPEGGSLCRAHPHRGTPRAGEG
ncbi:MAG: redoxin domain-containing protein [Armatimonadetes bacterium]|nr:redoxin domain-containing protein [Armatimonadota bacterium]